MRYLIYGAGAIGGTIGGLLAEAGRDVTLIARGAHLEAMRADGFRLVTPDRELRPTVRVASSPAEAAPAPGDVVVLAMKSQDTAAAIQALEPVTPPGVAVVCAQNGVANEAMVARRGLDAYGMCVIVPSTHLKPGVVALHSDPVAGSVDLGRWPTGADEVAGTVAADLRAAGFLSVAQPEIMRFKYFKLLDNLGNALEAATGDRSPDEPLYRLSREEGLACLAAAGIDVAPEDEAASRRHGISPVRPVGDVRKGSSSWQSLSRGAGTIEADWLNGEIVLLGRAHGVPTPVNAALQRVANRMAREGRAPGSITVEELRAEVATPAG